MAGLYLHIPFCKKACTYCDFHFSTSLQKKPDLVAAMQVELRDASKDWEKEIFESVYFGGGTPSLLDAKELGDLMQSIKQHYQLSDKPEITLEINPEDVNEQNLALWKSLGINRLSIGIQAFQDEFLAWMNRAHNSEMAISAVKKAQSGGFDNIPIDLIYGIPGLDLKQWQNNVAKALNLGVQHISCYALTVEDRTKLAKELEGGNIVMPKDELVLEQFDLLSAMAEERGFEHYEISNLSLPGKASKHNSNYWSRKSYLGIGPSAHSFSGNQRWWNIRSNQGYIKAITAGTSYKESETLSEKDVFNETIMTQLRTSSGVSTALWIDSGESPKNILQNQEIRELYSEELIYLESSRIKLTQKGRHLADGIAARLFK